MSERRQPGVIGSLPSTRPHRRSEKRARADEAGAPVAATDGSGSPAPAGAATPRPKPPRTTGTSPTGEPARASGASTQTTPAPAAEPPASAGERTPASTSSPGALQTAVEAAIELTEIGLRFGAQALRATLSRLLRP